MEKKVPIRMCIACREGKEKHELLKVVKTADGKIMVDETGKKPGKGAYICFLEECHKKLKKQRLLNRVFSMAVEDEVYSQIEQLYLKKQQKIEVK